MCCYFTPTYLILSNQKGDESQSSMEGFQSPGGETAEMMSQLPSQLEQSLSKGLKSLEGGGSSVTNESPPLL